MTVSNTTVKVTYNGNGNTRTWPITFPLMASAHLDVIVTDPNGVESTIHSGYSINEEWDALTYPTLETEQDPLPTGYKITLLRQTPFTQDLDLHVHTAIEAERLEGAYDKLTYHVQELKEEVGRAIKSNVSDSETESAADYLNTIKQAVTTAENAATSAATSSTSASTSAQVATNQATASYNSANAAASSAETAGQYASAAASSAQSAASVIGAHNTEPTAHADIRTELAGKQAILPDGANGLFLQKTADGVAWAKPSGGGGGGSVDWGNIGGLLENQTDLKNALDGKQAAGNYAAANHTHSQYLTAIPVADAATLGGVKPDGTTITSAADGTISAVGGGSSGVSATYDSTHKILTLE